MGTMAFKGLGYFTSFIVCSILAVTAGCASGGYKLTRQYAGFVNKQMIIIRIVLYLLTGIIFAVTMLADMVIFNTMDFWEGRVSAGDYQFQNGDKIFHVQHTVQPGSNLKRSKIKVMDKNQTQIQEVILSETADGKMEMTVDGQLRAEVRDVQSLPVATIFDGRGNFVKQAVVPLQDSPAPTLVSAVSRGW